MSHKSVISILAGIFCLSVVTSILFLSNSFFYPEIFYALFFVLMVVACIVFFRIADRAKTVSKKIHLVKVDDSDVFLFSSKVKSHKNLFLKVSIIAFSGLFHRK